MTTIKINRKSPIDFRKATQGMCCIVSNKSVCMFVTVNDADELMLIAIDSGNRFFDHTYKPGTPLRDVFLKCDYLVIDTLTLSVS